MTHHIRFKFSTLANNRGCVRGRGGSDVETSNRAARNSQVRVVTQALRLVRLNFADFKTISIVWCFCFSLFFSVACFLCNNFKG